MGWSANLSQGFSSGGSQNSAQNFSNSMSQSMSGTDAMSARQWSAMMADVAWQRDMYAMGAQMDYNAEEAEKQRKWQEHMANTIYTRSVANMRQAGINPILAANMGLSGAAVGSGATASLGGVPSAPLAQSFMDSWSASNSMSHGEGWSEGSSWNNSENGLLTALSGLANIIGNALNVATSGQNINIALEGLEQLTNHASQGWQNQKTMADSAVNNKKYESPYYPHEPGRAGSSESNMKLYDQITNFAKGLVGKITDNGGGHNF